MPSAEGTAIRGGLSVLGSAKGPPARCRPVFRRHPAKNCTLVSLLSSRAVQEPTRHVVFHTSRHRINGHLRLPSDGYRSRLSDYLNAPERTFLPLTDVEITPLDGSGEAERREFLALSVRHVVFAAPLDEAP